MESPSIKIGDSGLSLDPQFSIQFEGGVVLLRAWKSGRVEVRGEEVADNKVIYEAFTDFIAHHRRDATKIANRAVAFELAKEVIRVIKEEDGVFRRADAVQKYDEYVAACGTDI